LRANLFALDASLAPDLADVDLGPFLASREMPASIARAHGGASPILSAAKAVDPPDDGLPVALEQVIARLRPSPLQDQVVGHSSTTISERLTAHCRDPRRAALATPSRSTGNEQFGSVDAVARAVARDARAPACPRRLYSSVLYLETPLARQATLMTDVHALAHDVRLLIERGPTTATTRSRGAAQRLQRSVEQRTAKGPTRVSYNATALRSCADAAPVRLRED
jgi:hypothetical protein